MLPDEDTAAELDRATAFDDDAGVRQSIQRLLSLHADGAMGA